MNADFSVLSSEEGGDKVDFKASIALSDAVVTAGFSVLNKDEMVVDTIKDNFVKILAVRSPEASVSVEVDTAAVSGSVLDREEEGEDSNMVGSLDGSVNAKL